MASSQPLPQVLNPYKNGDCWVLHIKDDFPTVDTLDHIPWQQCSMVEVNISPKYDSPDPEHAPMLDLTHAQSYMIAITAKAASISAKLKGKHIKVS